MTVKLEMERDPVLANMSRLEVVVSYVGLVWDLGEEFKRFTGNYHGDQYMNEYIKDADELTVILRLVDRARDHALELSVRPVEDEVGTDA
jgi:hypothetical protein